jgi:hypothetical protein
VPQLAAARVFHNFAHVASEDYWSPSDETVGI